MRYHFSQTPACECPERPSWIAGSMDMFKASSTVCIEETALRPACALQGFLAVHAAQRMSQSTSDIHALFYQAKFSSMDSFVMPILKDISSSHEQCLTNLYSAAFYVGGPFMPDDAAWALSIVRVLSLKYCATVRRQQTALKGHLVLPGHYTCHIQNGFKSIHHRKQHSKSHMPVHCRITCCAECTDTVTFGFWNACITCRVQNRLVIHHHTQQHLGQQPKYECSATFTCSAACMHMRSNGHCLWSIHALHAEHLWSERLPWPWLDCKVPSSTMIRHLRLSGTALQDHKCCHVNSDGYNMINCILCILGRSDQTHFCKDTPICRAW